MFIDEPVELVMDMLIAGGVNELLHGVEGGHVAKTRARERRTLEACSQETYKNASIRSPTHTHTHTHKLNVAAVTLTGIYFEDVGLDIAVVKVRVIQIIVVVVRAQQRVKTLHLVP